MATSLILRYQTIHNWASVIQNSASLNKSKLNGLQGLLCAPEHSNPPAPYSSPLADGFLSFVQQWIICTFMPFYLRGN